MHSTKLLFWRLIEKAVNVSWELRLGIRTRGFQEDAPSMTNAAARDDLILREYVPTSYSLIFQILDFLELTPSDVLVDLGCGKGRVVCCAARYPLAEVIGVEDVPILSDCAEANAARMRGRNSKVSIVRCKAEDFDYARGSVFFLYNPFGPRTLNAVLRRLELAGVSGWRLVYFNPIHEAVLNRKHWMERYAHWPASPDLRVAHPVSFWRTITK